MESLVHQRCFNHARREAAAQCPVCRRYYCRECITEHEERVLCANCLGRKLRKAERRVARLKALGHVLGAAVSFLVLWFVFFGFGRLLLRLPASFHEGTIWPAAGEIEE